MVPTPLGMALTTADSTGALMVSAVHAPSAAANARVPVGGVLLRVNGVDVSPSSGHTESTVARIIHSGLLGPHAEARSPAKEAGKDCIHLLEMFVV